MPSQSRPLALIFTVFGRVETLLDRSGNISYAFGSMRFYGGQGGPRMAYDLIRRVQTLGKPRILVVGDLILDRYVWGYAERISQEAPVPLLRADTSRAPARRGGERGHDAPRPRGRGLPDRRRRRGPRGRPASGGFSGRSGDRRPARSWPSTTGRRRSRSGTSAGRRTGTRSR